MMEIVKIDEKKIYPKKKMYSNTFIPLILIPNNALSLSLSLIPFSFIVYYSIPLLRIELYIK